MMFEENKEIVSLQDEKSIVADGEENLTPMQRLANEAKKNAVSQYPFRQHVDYFRGDSKEEAEKKKNTKKCCPRKVVAEEKKDDTSKYSDVLKKHIAYLDEMKVHASKLKDEGKVDKELETSIADLEAIIAEEKKPERTGDITSGTISEHWTAQTGEHWMATKGKGWITVKGTNLSAKHQDPKCPYREALGDSAEVVRLLKHPCDTGCVNADGSINMTNLYLMLENVFEHDQKTDTYFMRLSRMREYLAKCALRDSGLPAKIHWSMPSYVAIADGEWKDMFRGYSDGQRDGEDIVSLPRLLKFYFNPKELNDHALAEKVRGKKIKIPSF